MSWLPKLGTVAGKFFAGTPIINLEPVPANITLIHINDVPGMLDFNQKINIPLLKQGCEICKIPFLGGGIVFCKANTDQNEELNNLKRTVSKTLDPKSSYIFAYMKEQRNHPTLAYYTIIGIRSKDALDLKMALKVHKLKAFL